MSQSSTRMAGSKMMVSAYALRPRVALKPKGAMPRSRPPPILRTARRRPFLCPTAMDHVLCRRRAAAHLKAHYEDRTPEMHALEPYELAVCQNEKLTYCDMEYAAAVDFARVTRLAAGDRFVHVTFGIGQFGALMALMTGCHATTLQLVDAHIEASRVFKHELLFSRLWQHEDLDAQLDVVSRKWKAPAQHVHMVLVADHSVAAEQAFSWVRYITRPGACFASVGVYVSYRADLAYAVGVHLDQAQTSIINAAFAQGLRHGNGRMRQLHVYRPRNDES